MLVRQASYQVVKVYDNYKNHKIWNNFQTKKFVYLNILYRNI